MKNLYLILFLLLFSLSGNAQGEYNNWVFGTSIRLDFNSGVPIESNNVMCDGSAAFSSISDAQGNLLFYSDVTQHGMLITQHRGSVYNTQNQIMQNGDHLYGDHLIQSTNILPFPCNDSLYYVFNLSKETLPYNRYSLYYSVVNMSANNGLGAVIQKNILLDSNLSTGFALTRHGNNTDYWISYKTVNSNIHVQRQITSNSIGPPVNSIIGTSGWGPTLKFSPNGTKLVSTFIGANLFEVYDFDNLTGTFSNPMYFTAPTSNTSNASFLVCSQFSPDMGKLYISGGSFLLQYDFSSNNPITINNSGMVLSSSYNPGGSSATLIDLALGLDNRIYVARGTTFLGRIKQPNNLGLLSQYDDTIMLLNGNSLAGFPSSLPPIFVHRDVLSDSLLCQYNTINLYLSDTTFIDSVSWNFGDTASGTANTSTDVIPLHVFNTYGIYPIEVIVYSGCITDTIHDTIRINPTPIAQLGNDTILCEGDSLFILSTDTNSNYLWSTNDTTLGIEVWQTGTYWVELSSFCGVDRDSIVIDSIIQPFVNFPKDTLMCTGDSLFLDATMPNTTYLWSTGDTVSSIWISITIEDKGVTFWVTKNNNCGTFSDTLKIDSEDIPILSNPVSDTAICIGEEFTVLVLKNNANSILWNDGVTQYQRTFEVANPHSYILQNICGQTTDSFNLIVEIPLQFTLGSDTMICYGEQIVKSFDYPNHSYLWNNGLTDSFQIITTTGIYGITIFTPAKCESYSDILVESCNAQHYIPNAFTPGNGDKHNNTFKVQGEGIRKYRIVIYDRWGLLVFESFDLDNSWNGLVYGKPSEQGIYYYKIWYNTGEGSESVTRIGSLSLIR